MNSNKKIFDNKGVSVSRTIDDGKYQNIYSQTQAQSIVRGSGSDVVRNKAWSHPREKHAENRPEELLHGKCSR